MIIRKPEVRVPIEQINANIVEKLERYARVCYKSEDNIISGSGVYFLNSIINRGHESVIEHEKVTVLFIIDRGVSHEVVRHRIASYSQESTRYCNYSREKFGNQITVIEPFFFVGKPVYDLWEQTCILAETNYMDLLSKGVSPQEARSILPNSLKTEIVVTFNIREWRHFFKLRCSVAAHPQMRQVSIPLLLTFKKHIPVLFDDIDYDIGFSPEHYADVLLTDEMLNLLG